MIGSVPVVVPVVVVPVVVVPVVVVPVVVVPVVVVPVVVVPVVVVPVVVVPVVVVPVVVVPVVVVPVVVVPVVVEPVVCELVDVEAMDAAGIFNTWPTVSTFGLLRWLAWIKVCSETPVCWEMIHKVSPDFTTHWVTAELDFAVVDWVAIVEDAVRLDVVVADAEVVDEGAFLLADVVLGNEELGIINTVPTLTEAVFLIPFAFAILWTDTPVAFEIFHRESPDFTVQIRGILITCPIFSVFGLLIRLYCSIAFIGTPVLWEIFQSVSPFLTVHVFGADT
jgi:hypothetical protein